MQIYSAEQLRLWDKYTIEHEPVSSIDLMERAASQCMQWLDENRYLVHSFTVFCGKGNNGGDGLAIARMLSAKKCAVVVYILEFGHKGTEDFQINLARLHKTDVEIRFIQTRDNFREIPANDIVIDALFGCGLNRPLDGLTAELIDAINNSGNEIIAIDLPSGLYVDKSSVGNKVIRASVTLSFQCYKLAFLVAENAALVGSVHILDIGLDKRYPLTIENNLELVGHQLAAHIYRPRKEFAHKGDFGHALLIAGALGKMGAALLAAKACLRSGIGLLTCHIPACGYTAMQTAIPEAMVELDNEEKINSATAVDLSNYDVIGIGPGIGKDPATKKMLREIFGRWISPMVIDADALNIIGEEKALLNDIPPYSILTPHPKEFERIFGPAANDFERLQSAIENATKYQCVIVLKGHFTFVAEPGGKGTFNSTGNAGMAKGGSGDVLTGMITALVGQGYSAADAAVFGVYLHGLAADIAAADQSLEAMLPSDLVESIGRAYRKVSRGS